MKVLSLRQPWATLIVLGIKQIETRSWSTAYRGPLLIHASKGKAGEILTNEASFKKYIPGFQLPFGYIIGKVTLIDVIRIDNSPGFHTSDKMINKLTAKEKAVGDYTPGRFAWILQDPVAFKAPVSVKGRLRLWEYDEGLIEEISD